MNRDLHQLEVKDGHIFLDGMMLKGIADFNSCARRGKDVSRADFKDGCAYTSKINNKKYGWKRR